MFKMLSFFCKELCKSIRIYIHTPNSNSCCFAQKIQPCTSLSAFPHSWQLFTNSTQVQPGLSTFYWCFGLCHWETFWSSLHGFLIIFLIFTFLNSLAYLHRTLWQGTACSQPVSFCTELKTRRSKSTHGRSFRFQCMKVCSHTPEFKTISENNWIIL